MNSAAGRILTTLVFLILGAALFWWLPGGETGIPASAALPFLLAAAVIVGLIPPANRWIGRQLDRVRNPSPQARTRASIAIATAASAYLTFTAFRLDRDCSIPQFHDEHVYLLQTQMLAHGRLWYPQHPMADFFETFHVLVKPVYAPVYFPGASMLFVPAIWLNLPIWVIPVLIAGAIVGLLYRVTTELTDGVCGALACAAMLSLVRFRFISMLMISHPAALLQGLVLVWAWLRWRERRDWPHALLIGAVAGWAAITRPVDALCYAIPVGVMILLDIFWPGKLKFETNSKHEIQNPNRRRALAITAAMAVAGAAPFLLVQVIFNLGVTGKATHTPYNYNADLFFPQVSYGFHTYDPSLKPASTLPQKLFFHEAFDVPLIKAHQPNLVWDTFKNTRLPLLLDVTLPSRWLIPLLPLGLLGPWNRKRLAVAVTLPLSIGLYCFFAFYLPHYALLASPAIFVLMMLGVMRLQNVWPAWRSGVEVMLVLLVIALSVQMLPQLHGKLFDDPRYYPAVARAYHELPKILHTPAVVLYRFHGYNNPHDEPVYNDLTAWPDDAPIIRAHDLGPRNVEILHYYAKLQPDRMFYLYDRGREPKDDAIHPLGTAKDLAARFPTTAPTPP